MSQSVKITMAAKMKTPKTTPATMLAVSSPLLCDGAGVEVAETVVVGAEEVAAAGAIATKVEDFG